MVELNPFIERIAFDALPTPGEEDELSRRIRGCILIASAMRMRTIVRESNVLYLR
jgi:hypothetical protein